MFWVKNLYQKTWKKTLRVGVFSQSVEANLDLLEQGFRNMSSWSLPKIGIIEAEVYL